MKTSKRWLGSSSGTTSTRSDAGSPNLAPGARSGQAASASLRRLDPPCASLHAVAGKGFRNPAIDRFRGGEIGIAARRVAAPQLRQSAAVERVGVFCVVAQRGVVIGEGLRKGAAFELDERTVVESIAVVRLVAERLGAPSVAAE